jgi:hypothetical protein
MILRIVARPNSDYVARELEANCSNVGGSSRRACRLDSSANRTRSDFNRIEVARLQPDPGHESVM